MPGIILSQVSPSLSLPPPLPFLLSNLSLPIHPFLIPIHPFLPSFIHSFTNQIGNLLSDKGVLFVLKVSSPPPSNCALIDVCLLHLPFSFPLLLLASFRVLLYCSPSFFPFLLLPSFPS